MVITSYYSGLRTVIEWSRYHIRVVSLLKSGPSAICEGVSLERFSTVQQLIEQLQLGLFYLGGGVVDSLSCTTLGSVMKRLKESGLVVTQPRRNFDRYSFLKQNLEIQIQQFGNPKTTISSHDCTIRDEFPLPVHCWVVLMVRLIIVGSPMNRVSSAYKKCIILKPEYSPTSCDFLMDALSLSTTSQKRKGAKGSSCLIPF